MTPLTAVWLALYILAAGVLALVAGLAVRHILHRRRRRRALAELAAAQALWRRRVAIRRPDPVTDDDDAWIAEANAVVAAAWRKERTP